MLSALTATIISRKSETYFPVTRLLVASKTFFLSGRAMATLESLNFDNRALRSLPVDRDEEIYSRSVPGACYSRVRPTPVNNPTLVAVSLPALALLELPQSEAERPEFAEYFSGNKLLPGAESAAHCYCGHQFGNFAGQLGDGCALYLGEVVNGRGERWELQFKGSGKTPYSRQADGRKVLRSSIREFLCSEAMHFLGIPTTRAGSCVTSDTRVARDIFYNGNVIHERATIISRIAPTFLRFGSFEIFKTRDRMTGRTGPSVGRIDIFHQLLDYVIKSYFPQIYEAYTDDRTKQTAAFFHEVCLLTARLVAMWQCVGFCHGVLNTDNMSIVGLTIDYGPYGFLDRFDPDHICNGSDEGGRYAYNRQPAICQWNLKKLAEALSPCLDEQTAQEGLKMYESEFERTYLDKMKKKLGLLRKSFPDDSNLVESFMDVMHETACDFTNGFRNLNKLSLNRLGDSSSVEQAVEAILGHCCTPQELAKQLKPRLTASQLQTFAVLKASPLLLMQLGVSSQFIDSELAKMEQVDKIKETSPDEKRQKDKRIWLQWMEKYRSRLLQEVDGLTEEEIVKAQEERLQVMNASNPRFILRNHIAQRAIECAEKGDYSEVKRVLKLLQTPYAEDAVVDSIAQPTETTPRERECQTASAAEVGVLDTRRQVNQLSHYFHRPPESALGVCVT